jgi:hypothetical protein
MASTGRCLQVAQSYWMPLMLVNVDSPSPRVVLMAVYIPESQRSAVNGRGDQLQRKVIMVLQRTWEHLPNIPSAERSFTEANYIPRTAIMQKRQTAQYMYKIVPRCSKTIKDICRVSAPCAPFYSESSSSSSFPPGLNRARRSSIPRRMSFILSPLNAAFASSRFLSCS